MEVAIVGKGMSYYDYVMDVLQNGGEKLCDEIWAINGMAGVIQNDIMWHLDDLRLQGHKGDDREVLGQLETAKLHPKVITSTAYPEFPGSEAYPLEEVVNCIGLPYINTTVAAAVGYAIYKGVERLRLYGCDFTYPNRHEAESGRGCVEFLLGIGMERGMAVYIAPHSTLLDMSIKEKYYGYEKYDVDWQIAEDGHMTPVLTEKKKLLEVVGAN